MPTWDWHWDPCARWPSCTASLKQEGREAEAETEARLSWATNARLQTLDWSWRISMVTNRQIGRELDVVGLPHGSSGRMWSWSMWEKARGGSRWAFVPLGFSLLHHWFFKDGELFTYLFLQVIVGFILVGEADSFWKAFSLHSLIVLILDYGPGSTFQYKPFSLSLILFFLNALTMTLMIWFNFLPELLWSG